MQQFNIFETNLVCFHVLIVQVCGILKQELYIFSQQVSSVKLKFRNPPALE